MALPCSWNVLGQNEADRRETRRVTYIPFLLADPQLVERAETSEHTTAHPPAVLALDRVTRCVDLDLRVLGK